MELIPKIVPAIESWHKYQPPSIIAPTGMKTGFKVMSEYVPKVEVHVGGLSLQQSSLVIMREDFMNVVAGNVAFQNSPGPVPEDVILS